MRSVIGIISSTYSSNALMELTKARPIASVPFGGRYRLIDFALSNMVNTGIRTVGIISPYNYRSVLDHLRSGKDWSLDRKTGGLFILPSTDKGEGKATFILRDLVDNIDFLKKAKEDDVVISASNMVINMNYKEALAFHRENRNDMTIIYKEDTGKAKCNKRILYLDQDKDGRVEGISTNLPGNGDERKKGLLNIIIVKRELLISIIKEYARMENEDFLYNIASRIKNFRVYGFEFKGYMSRIDCVKSYFDSSLDLLRPEARIELFMRNDKVHTKITDNAPSMFGTGANVEDSLVGSGCRIEGSVQGSILFREVEVKPDTFIRNSIIMQKSLIGKNVILENVILDKFVTIKDNTIIRGQEDNPRIIEKASIIGAREGI